MKQIFGKSQSGNLQEAVRSISRPQLLMLFSNSEQFEKHVKELEELYPGVPSIGCIGMSYDTQIVEKGVSVIKGLNPTPQMFLSVRADCSGLCVTA